MDIRAEIQAGVCGFHCVVEASSPDGMNVVLRIESDCPRLQALAAELITVDAFQEVLRNPVTQATPVLLSAKHRLHPTCVVPAGILKAIEAAAGLALPAESTVRLVRIE